MNTPSVTIRSLGYSDLPQGISIERRAFPTPWSLAMFVLELSKPSGVCLAAIEERRIVGYLICSRYADVWHLMNIAIDPPARRRGIATALLEEMIARAGEDSSYTLEVRPSNSPANEKSSPPNLEAVGNSNARGSPSAANRSSAGPPG